MAAAEAAAVVLSSCLKPVPAPVPESAGTAAATAATSSAMAAAAAVAAAARTGSEARVSKPALATKLLSLSGVFAVHKPKGPTSAELLNRLKEKLLAEAGMPSPEWTKRKKQTLKIGHGGTLDSAARGVLVEVLREYPSGSMVENPPAMQDLQEMQVQSLGGEDPLEEGMAAHSGILEWRIP